MKPHILERALTGHKGNKYYIFKSFITGRWHVIHRGQIIGGATGDPTQIDARQRAYYHWKGHIL